MNTTHATAPVTAQIRLPDQSAVRFSGVTVKNHDAITLNDVDLSIQRNTCYGIVGNSRASLSAVADLIATAQHPSRGTVSVIGFDAAAEAGEIRRRLGYLPHPHTVPPHLRAAEFLQLQAAASGVPKPNWDSTIETLLTLVGIAGRQRALTDQLSPPARQLLGVAGALVNDPQVVVLHEPTAGLDPRAAARLWNMLHRLTDVSRTIIVCSRHLSELAAGCARIAIVDDARIVDEGPPTDVVSRLGGARRIRARLANGVVRTHSVADAAAQGALLRKLVTAGLDLIEFTEVAPELDDLTLDDPARTTRPADSATAPVVDPSAPRRGRKP